MVIINNCDNAGGNNGLSVPIIQPTKAGQIPVAVIDPLTGTRTYAPTSNRLLPQPTAADIGKGVFINAVDTDGNVTYEFKAAQVADKGTESLVNQTGVYGRPAVTKKNDTTISIGAYQAYFYNELSDTLDKIVVPAQDVVISATTDPLNTSDVTWVQINKDGTYSQTNTEPTDQINNIFMAKVLHPGGGLIKYVRSDYTVLDQVQSNTRRLFTELGLFENDFSFIYSSLAATIVQNSTTARLVGYNINSDPGVPNQINPSVIVFPTGDVSFEYYSYNPALAVASKANLQATYQIDNPVTKTSTAMGNNNFGILLLFAYPEKKYLILAPQLEYTSATAAKSAVSFYLESVVKPPFVSSEYALVAIIIVPRVVTAGTTTVEIASYSGQNTGGAPLQGVTLPAASTGIGRVISDGANYLISNTAPESISTAGATNGQILTVQGNAISYVTPTPGVISSGNVAVLDPTTKYSISKISSFTVASPTITVVQDSDFDITYDLTNSSIIFTGKVAKPTAFTAICNCIITTASGQFHNVKDNQNLGINPGVEAIIFIDKTWVPPADGFIVYLEYFIVG